MSQFDHDEAVHTNNGGDIHGEAAPNGADFANANAARLARRRREAAPPPTRAVMLTKQQMLDIRHALQLARDNALAQRDRSQRTGRPGLADFWDRKAAAYYDAEECITVALH